MLRKNLPKNPAKEPLKNQKPNSIKIQLPKPTTIQKQTQEKVVTIPQTLKQQPEIPEQVKIIQMVSLKEKEQRKQQQILESITGISKSQNHRLQQLVNKSVIQKEQYLREKLDNRAFQNQYWILNRSKYIQNFKHDTYI